MRMFYQAAEKGVMIARMIAAAYYCVLALLLLRVALWFVLPLSQGWLWIIVGTFFAVGGFASLAKAAEIFVSAKPPERQRPQQLRQQERQEQPERQRQSKKTRHR